MKLSNACALLLLFAGPLAAQSQFSLQPKAGSQQVPESMLGIWGTAEQCAAHAAGAGDNPALLPYHMTGDWIRQGHIYCYLSWRGQDNNGARLRAYAVAQCGEDDLREYRLTLRLQQDSLRIRWSDDFVTRELMACR